MRPRRDPAWGSPRFSPPRSATAAGAPRNACRPPTARQPTAPYGAPRPPSGPPRSTRHWTGAEQDDQNSSPDRSDTATRSLPDRGNQQRGACVWCGGPDRPASGRRAGAEGGRRASRTGCSRHPRHTGRAIVGQREPLPGPGNVSDPPGPAACPAPGQFRAGSWSVSQVTTSVSVIQIVCVSCTSSCWTTWLRPPCLLGFGAGSESEARRCQVLAFLFRAGPGDPGVLQGQGACRGKRTGPDRWTAGQISDPPRTAVSPGR